MGSPRGNIQLTRLHTLNEQLQAPCVNYCCYCSCLRQCSAQLACSGGQWAPPATSGTCVDLCFCENCNKGVNNARDRSGSTPLMQAAETNSAFAAKLLLENSANVDSANSIGVTALHIAARDNSVDVAKVLIQNSANVNSANIRGDTPLHWAAYKNSVDVARLLLAKSANL